VREVEEPQAGERRVPRVYRSGRRAAQARQTRQRVLAAATEVFLRRGYAGATVRLIAEQAGVSVPTVESLFGAKARLLKAAIDVAIAGDDEPVGVLDRDWAAAAARAGDAEELLAIAAGVIGPAQVRSAGLVLAVFEGSPTDAELAGLSRQLVTQRAGTAAWLVDQLAAKAALRAGLSRQDAVDTVWLLMDPAVFDRFTRHLGRPPERYPDWLARSLRQLLIADDPAEPIRVEVKNK
jgi:AcrR family transcriptional regulator